MSTSADSGSRKRKRPCVIAAEVEEGEISQGSLGFSSAPKTQHVLRQIAAYCGGQDDPRFIAKCRTFLAEKYVPAFAKIDGLAPIITSFLMFDKGAFSLMQTNTEMRKWMGASTGVRAKGEKVRVPFVVVHNCDKDMGRKKIGKMWEEVDCEALKGLHVVHGKWWLFSKFPANLEMLDLGRLTPVQRQDAPDVRAFFIAKRFPSSLKRLRLDLFEAFAEGGLGASNLGKCFPPNLTSLVLNLRSCQGTPEAWASVGRAFPSTLKRLVLFIGWGRPPTDRKDAWAGALTSHLPAGLTSLTMDVSGISLGAAAAEEMVRNFPSGLKSLGLILSHRRIGDVEPVRMVQSLPTGLTSLRLGVRGMAIDDDFAHTLLHAIPGGIDSVAVDFGECGKQKGLLWDNDPLRNNISGPLMRVLTSYFKKYKLKFS